MPKNLRTCEKQLKTWAKSLKKHLNGFVVTKLEYLQHATLWSPLWKHILQGTLRYVWISFLLNYSSPLPPSLLFYNIGILKKNNFKSFFSVRFNDENQEIVNIILPGQGHIQNVSIISDWVFYENIWWLQGITCFWKTLHLRCVTGFSHFESSPKIVNHRVSFENIKDI